MMRLEQDSVGIVPIYQDAYYGIHSYRAKENFETSGRKVNMNLVKQLATIKKACAYANYKAGDLTKEKMEVISQAADELISGNFQDDIIVDAIQGGAGTSTNMNVNEVLANRGLELLGHKHGEYNFLNPLDDVNRSQSTNDVYPSAGKLATLSYVEKLLRTLDVLILKIENKASEFATVSKMGRTQLQEAVPTTLGASFAAYASNLRRCKRRIKGASHELRELNMGGTAIGNALNASKTYQDALYAALQQAYGEPIHPAQDLIDATQNTDALVAVSGSLKTLAVSISKMSHDLRLLSSGPRSGFCEIKLPAKQAGSSIMPGKINPVIPEVVSQIAFQVMGNDTTITFAAESGELELNAFEPIMFHNLFESCQLLERGCLAMATKCMSGITANVDKCRADVANSTGVITRLAPAIGYETASKIVKESLATNVSVSEILRRKKIIVAADLFAQKIG